MYENSIFSKIFLSFFIFLYSITLGNTSKLSAEANNQIPSSNTSSRNIQINIPTENIKNIPIIGYKLIYITTYASLLDFLNNDIKYLANELSKAGFQSKNVVLIYTDYEGDSPSQYTLNQFSNKSNLAQNELNNYTTNEGINLNLSYIAKMYSLPFLLTKRKILIGTLVNDKITFNGNDNLKVVKFNIPDAMGFQTYENVNKSKITDKNLNNENKPSVFSKEEIILNRCSMIQYMNLRLNKKTKFIGMMQYYDIINNTYAYFGIPGKLE